MNRFAILATFLAACGASDDSGVYDDDPFAAWERALVGAVVTACEVPGEEQVLVELRSQEGADRLVFQLPGDPVTVLQTGEPRGSSGNAPGSARVVAELDNAVLNDLCTGTAG